MELVCETDPEDYWDGLQWQYKVADIYNLLGSMSLKQLCELEQYIKENY